MWNLVEGPAEWRSDRPFDFLNNHVARLVKWLALSEYQYY
jgi:hypothetical protein